MLSNFQYGQIKIVGMVFNNLCEYFWQNVEISDLIIIVLELPNIYEALDWPHRPIPKCAPEFYSIIL